MDNATAWALIIGAVLPFLIAVVNRPKWSGTVRQIVAVAISLAVGLVTVVVQGAADFTLQGALVTLAAVVGAAQATYALVWKPSKIAPVLERVTTPGPEGLNA